MVFESEAFAGHEQVVFAHETDAGLRAIIAIHSTVLGPAIGGCRIHPYQDEAAALRDVLRLSQGMSAKAAIAGVPFGGGKAVVMADPATNKSPALMRALGRAIDQLGGRYVTGEDVGTTSADMGEIRRETPHVMGMPPEQGGSGDPSPMTALGCLVGIQAAVLHRLGRRDLTGLRVAVQGLGNVGFDLCRRLAEAGAVLTVADVREPIARHCAEALGATAVAPAHIFDADVDVFAPCALGAVIDDNTVGRLRAVVVAGGANNQLANAAHGAALRSQGILYAPDYVINAGGMIQLAIERMGADPAEVERRVRAIHDTLLSIFLTADERSMTTAEAADRLVAERLSAAKDQRTTTAPAA